MVNGGEGMRKGSGGGGGDGVGGLVRDASMFLALISEENKGGEGVVSGIEPESSTLSKGEKR